MDNRQIDQQLKQIWGSDSPEYDASLAIVQFLQSEAHVASHITFSLLFQLAKNQQVNDAESVLCAVRYLSGPDLHMLDMRFSFFGNDDEPQADSFSTVELAEIKRQGKYLDPQTGVDVFDIDNRFHCYFVPSSLAKSIFSSAGQN